MVKLAICQVPSKMTGTRTIEARSLGGSWAQFGDQLLLFAEDARWSELRDQAKRGSVTLREHLKYVKRDHLHLVMQKGRLFQQQFPDVPVLLDRGRFLVVELHPERAEQLAEPKEPCYAVRSLRDNEVVYELRDRISARAPLPRISKLVESVKRQDFESDLVRLASFPSRVSTSTHFAEAAEWAKAQLEELNYIVRPEIVTLNTGTTQNIVGYKSGRGSDPRDVALVVAHLDSINSQSGSSLQAPGADDNASGSAGLLQIARSLKDQASDLDLRLVLFGGEEQGLVGSRRYVEDLTTEERTRIRAVINMDMIASRNTSAYSVLLEGGPVSESVIDGLAEAAATYTELQVQTSLNPFLSDHVPFIELGISAVLTIEGADDANHNIHSGNDTVDHIDFELGLQILRMNVAFLAGALGI